MTFKRTTTKKDEVDGLKEVVKKIAVKKTAVKKDGPSPKKLSELLKSDAPLDVEIKAPEPLSTSFKDEQLELPLQEETEIVVAEPEPEPKPKPKPEPKPEVIVEVPQVKKVVPDAPKAPREAPLWRKKPRTGDHRMPDGTMVTGTMVIKAWPEEIAGVLDKFVRLTPAINGDDGPPPPNATLTVKQREYGGFDVVNPDGVPLNATSLTKEEAESLVNGLTE